MPLIGTYPYGQLLMEVWVVPHTPRRDVWAVCERVVGRPEAVLHSPIYFGPPDKTPGPRPRWLGGFFFAVGALKSAKKIIETEGGVMHRDQLPGGLADKKKPSDFDPEQLQRGIAVETEHTRDRALAREIAMDHLAEIPDYYTRLAVMEQQAKAERAGPREPREPFDDAWDDAIDAGSAAAAMGWPVEKVLEVYPDEPHFQDAWIEGYRDWQGERYATEKKIEAIKAARSRKENPMARKPPLRRNFTKPEYADDFKAGFAAGKRAYDKDKRVSKAHAQRDYKRVGKKHGSWWVDGYCAAIDLARGAYNTTGAQIARNLGLAGPRQNPQSKFRASVEDIREMEEEGQRPFYTIREAQGYGVYAHDGYVYTSRKGAHAVAQRLAKRREPGAVFVRVHDPARRRLHDEEPGKPVSSDKFYGPNKSNPKAKKVTVKWRKKSRQVGKRGGTECCSSIYTTTVQGITYTLKPVQGGWALEGGKHGRYMAPRDMTEAEAKAFGKDAIEHDVAGAGYVSRQHRELWHDSGNKSNPKNPGTLVSLLFNRRGTYKWTPTRAREWAKRKGYKASNADMEITEGKVRIRQTTETFPEYRTVAFGKGIKAIFGWTEEAWEEGPPKRTMKTMRKQAAAKRRSPRSKAGKAAAKTPGTRTAFMSQWMKRYIREGYPPTEAMKRASADWKKEAAKAPKKKAGKKSRKTKKR